MNIHCSTCGQDLPEPQRRLAEAELAEAQARKAVHDARAQAMEHTIHAELSAVGLLKSDEEIAAELDDLYAPIRRIRDEERARGVRGWIKDRQDLHSVDDTWWLRDYEQDERNRRRYNQFSLRTRLFGLTVPMERATALTDPLPGPVIDGALGTFHHPV